MQFHVRTRRQPPAVIVVALIDVLVVLVIFLVITTTFKQQPALKLALPDSSQAKREGANERPPLVVYIDKQGSLRLGGGARPVTLERLRDELLSQQSANTNLLLAISADEKAPWGSVVKVWDIAKELKLKSVSAFTKSASDK